MGQPIPYDQKLPVPHFLLLTNKFGYILHMPVAQGVRGLASTRSAWVQSISAMDQRGNELGVLQVPEAHPHRASALWALNFCIGLVAFALLPSKK